MLDGEFWRLELKLAGSRRRAWAGDNAFPDNWDDLETLFKQFYKEFKMQP